MPALAGVNDTINVVVLRNGERVTLRATLGERTAGGGANAPKSPHGGAAEEKKPEKPPAPPAPPKP